MAPRSMTALLSLLLAAFALTLTPTAAQLRYLQPLTLGSPYRPSFNQILTPGQSAQFALTVPASAVQTTGNDVRIVVTPIGQEEPTIFADFRQQIGSNNAKYFRERQSRADGDLPTLWIPNSDFAQDSGQTPPYVLYITVECASTVERYCMFTIASSANNRQSLWPGFQHGDKARAGSVQYYEFRPQWYNNTLYPVGQAVDATHASGDIQITATALRGRISIYVISTALPGTTLPSPFNYQWGQSGYTNEVILIPGDALGRVSGQTFLIAVYAEDAGTTSDGMTVYQLQVQYDEADQGSYDIQFDRCMWLNNGVSTPGQSTSGGSWDQYCFLHLAEQCPMDVTLTVLSGEQDLYLWYNGSFQNIDTGVGNDNIRLTPYTVSFFALVIFTPNNDFGRYNVLYNSNCTSGNQLLSVKRFDEAAHNASMAVLERQYLASITDLPVQVAEQLPEWQANADASASGTPDLLVERQTDTVEQALYESHSPITIADFNTRTYTAENTDSDSDSAHHFHTQSVAGGLLGITAPATFHAIQLTQGQPQYGEATLGQIIRYVYHPKTYHQDFTFELTRVLGGDPNIYISTSTASSFPMPHSSQWYSNFTGNDYITVDRFDDNACVRRDCYYHITVFIAEESRATPVTGWTLQVSEGEAHTDLQNGRTYTNRLQAGAPDYLRFVVTQPGQTVTITLTDTARGYPRMYVSSQYPYPNATYSEFYVLVNQVSATLEVEPTNPYACLPTRTKPCYYWIAVIANTNTTYSIVATAGGLIELRNGVYQEGSVNQDEMVYYRYNVAPGYTRFAVSLALISGLGQLYVSNALNKLPTVGNSSSYVQWRNYTQLTTPITIYEDNTALRCNFGTRTQCEYVIGVYGLSGGDNRKVRFALLATEGLRASVGVQNGVPIRQVIPVNQTYYWWAPLVDEDQRIQICVTVYNGDVTGYTSSSPDNTYPDERNFELRWGISPPGYGCIFNPSTGKGQRYWSLTNPSLISSASISVMFLSQISDNDTSAQVQLYDGVPQAMYLYSEQTRIINQQIVVFPPNPLVYFNFYNDRVSENLEFSLYTIFGDADLYLNYIAANAATRFPSKSRHDYFSALAGSDIINIGNAAAGRYLGVIFNTAGSAYLITASTGLVPTILQNGVPQRGFVLTGRYKFYQLQVTDPSMNIEISLVATRGNPDLYANPGSSLSFTKDTATWRSEQGGSDFITIEAGARFRPNTPFTLTIAVYAPTTDSDYILTASFTNSFFLQPNMPVNGRVSAGGYSYYGFRPNNLDDIIDITVTPQTGSPRLIASHINPQPTITNYTSPWSYIPALHAPAYLRLNPNITTHAVNMCKARGIPQSDCVYYIGVYGNQGENSTFTIIAGQPGGFTQLLSTGNPQAGVVRPGETVRYYFLNQAPGIGRTVAFSLSPLNNLDANLYVSTNDTVSNTNWQWRSEQDGLDVIAIKDAPDLYYYVAIYNPLSVTVSYDIFALAYSSNVPGDGAIYLSLDTPVNDLGAGGTYRYYRYFITGHPSKIIVNVVAKRGDPDIYVTQGTLFTPAQWPSNTNWEWFDNGVLANTSLVINNPPATGYLYIAILAWGTIDNYYTITIKNQDSMTQLTSGSALDGSVAQGEYNYYYYNLGTVIGNQTLTFSLLPISGDPDLFVSDVFRNPTGALSNWTTSRSGGQMDVINLSPLVITEYGRPEVHTGIYYVSVFGFYSSQYRIYARYGARMILENDKGISSSVANGNIVYFDVYYPSNTDFRVSTSTYSGSWHYLYISTTQDPIPQASSTYQWSSTVNGSITQETHVTGSSNCPNNFCRYYIGVFSPVEQTSSSFSYFYIVAQQNTSSETLVPGVPTPGTVPPAGYTHYRFNVACAQARVWVTLQPTTGNPDLLVNRGPEWPVFGLNNTLWQSRNLSSTVDIVYFDWNSPYFRQHPEQVMSGEYLLSVYNAGTAQSTYTLNLTIINGNCSALPSSSTGGSGPNPSTGGISTGGISTGGISTGSVASSTGVAPAGFTPLTANIPQQSRLLRDQYNYFSFTTPPTSVKAWPYSVYISVTPLAAGSDPDIFVRKDGGFPRFGDSQWSSRSVGSDFVIISETSSPAPCVPTATAGCFYTIGIHAYSDTEFTVVASTSALVFGAVLDRALTSQSVSSRAWNYYAVNITNTNLPFVSILTPLSNNPDLYVAYNQLPDFNSPHSKTFGVDVVTISNPQIGTWYVGVFGETSTGSSSYNLVATQAGIELLNGQPQSDVLNTDESRFYYFDFSTTSREAFNLQIDAIAFSPAVDVYIRNDGGVLSANSYMWALRSNATWPMSLTVTSSQTNWLSNARYRVLVVSRSNSAAFAVTTTRGDSPIILTNGRPVDSGANAVSMSSFRYYRVYVANTEKDLVWSLTMMQGSASLYLSATAPLPGPSNNQYSGNTQGGRSIVLRVPSATLRVGWYYAAVHADWSDIRYTITAASGAILMQAGDSQTIACSEGTRTFVLYLPWNSTDAAQPITFYFSPADWNSQSYTQKIPIYISIVRSNLEPSPTNGYTWTAQIDWTNPFTIQRADTNLQTCIRNGQCQLNIAMGCTSASNSVKFVFSVEVGASLLPVLAGSTIRGTQLTQGSERHYTAAISRASFAQLILESCQGQTQLFVNYLHSGIPTLGNADQQSLLPNIIHNVEVPQQLTDSRLFMTVRSTTSTPASYQLRTLTNTSWEEQSPVISNDQLTVQSYLTTQLQRIRFQLTPAQVPPMARAGRVPVPSGYTATLKYTAFYVEEGENVRANLFTECGLLATATAVPSVYTADLDAAAHYITFLAPPKSAVKYSINVHVAYVFMRRVNKEVQEIRATPGYAVYRYVDGLRPGSGTGVDPTPGGDDSTGGQGPTVNTASNTLKIVLGLGIPLLVVLAAAVYHYYKKSKNSVPVNNILGLDTDQFASAEGDKHQSLLKEEASAGRSDANGLNGKYHSSNGVEMHEDSESGTSDEPAPF